MFSQNLKTFECAQPYTLADIICKYVPILYNSNERELMSPQQTCSVVMLDASSFSLKK